MKFKTENILSRYNNSFILLSVFSLFILLFSFSFFGIVTNLFLCLYLYFDIKKTNITSKKKEKPILLFLLIILGLICYRFYAKWHSSSVVESFLSLLRVPSDVTVLIMGVLLCIVSSNSLYLGLMLGINKLDTFWERDDTIKKSNEKVDLFALSICVISAFVTIALCSKSSFIYPFNDWDDSNCFFTVGKSMMNGIVPYKDLFEQKGPLLYLLHGLSWLISNDSFLGVYFLESVCATFFLYYSYKTASLYCGKKTIILIPALSAICYSSLPFKDGDSAEELCLPFLVISLYLITLSLKSNEGYLSKNQLFIVGLMSGCVFWMKFSLIGMYFGWFIAFVICSLAKGKYKEIIESVIFISLGVFVSTFPFIVYFGMNNALLDWYEVYIYDNLFLYSGEPTSIFHNLWFGFMQVVEKNTTVYNCCLAGLLFYFYDRNKKSFIYYALMLTFEFVLIYAGGRHYRYYSFALDAFSSVGLSCMFVLFANDFYLQMAELRNNKLFLALFTIVCMALSFFFTPNRYLLNYKKSDVPQYRFAEIINQKEKSTLLNYDFLDGGFYTAANIIPNCKAFCKLNIEIQELIDMQDKYIKECLCDFIVSKKELSSDKYIMLEKITFPYNDTTQTFYLYGLK